MTKREFYTAIAEMELTTELREYVENELIALETKRANAAAKRADKVDAMVDTILQIVRDSGETPMTAEDVVNMMPAEMEPTRQKMTARLSNMVKNGILTKVEIPGVSSTGKRTKHTAYRVANV